jgi:ankyrin repeat protein
VEALKLLLNIPTIQINIQDKKSGNSALIYCALNGKVMMMKLLLWLFTNCINTVPLSSSYKLTSIIDTFNNILIILIPLLSLYIQLHTIHNTDLPVIVCALISILSSFNNIDTILT